MAEKTAPFLAIILNPEHITLAEARSLTATAAEVGRLLSVFQNRRWDSDFQGIKREIAAEALANHGALILVEMTPAEPARERGRFQALEGQTWNNLALTGGLLLVRNGREAAAWRLPLAD